MKAEVIIHKALKNVHYLALAAVLITVILANRHNKFWKIEGRIISHDVILYYQYLPSTFIYGDVALRFLSGGNSSYFDGKIWGKRLENGKHVNKMTMGVAVMYSPFFFAAHALAGPMGYDASGFSPPYKVALIISSIFYLAIGLYLLMRVLLKYFPGHVAAITLVAIGLGTNLYFYTTIEPTMSHAYSFCLFALFIWALERWLERNDWKNAALLGFATGMIALVRPSNLAIVVLIPLWQVASFGQLGHRLKWLAGSYVHIGIMLLVFTVVVSPQIAYWKYISGSYLYYGYGEEGFFFNDPEFIKGIFSYRKGWLVYTPIMVFALAGLAFLWKSHRGLFFPVTVYVLVHMYIAFSWWCWWYGGGFGQRMMVETYVLLAIPFAAFTKWITGRHFAFWILFGLIAGFLIFLNMFQARQYYYGSIHWNSMSKEAYWDSFLRKKPSKEFPALLDHPDYGAALKGER